MRIQRVKFFRFLLIFVVAIATFQGTVNAQKTAPQLSDEDRRTSSSLTVSDLFSFSTELSGRLSTLQRNMGIGFNLAAFEKDLAKKQEQLKVVLDGLNEMEAEGGLGYERLLELKGELIASAKQLEKSWEPFAGRIKQVEHWSYEWSKDKERLLALESSLPKDESYKIVIPRIAKAKETTDKAGKLISDNLNSLLQTENMAADVQATSDLLVAEIDGLLQSLRGDLFHKSAPSMFSSKFYGQFNTVLGNDLGKSFEFIFTIQSRGLQRNLLFILLQVAFWLISTGIIIRNRAALAAEPHLLFLAERPLSAGVLIGSVAFFSFYEPSHGLWRAVISAAAFFCVARLSGCCITGLWRRRAVYGIVIVLIINEFFKLSVLPDPLYRLYVLMISLIGLFFCFWRMPTTTRPAEAQLYRWALRGGVAVFGIIIVANVSGYRTLAVYLFESSLGTVMLFLLGRILIEFGRGSLDRVFKSAFVTRVPLLQKNSAAIVLTSSRLLNGLVGAFITIYLLVSWGGYEKGSEALGSIMTVGFSIGSWKVNVGLILTVVLCLYGSLLVSRAVQSILVEEVFPRRGVERGVQISMSHLIHYAILLVGFLLALAALGVNFTNITILGGALGVGIGFGLQNIVNNFVSGLILLFERPVRVGDFIEIGNLRSEIKKIGLRATIVETLDRADIVIPNSDLVTSKVTNWTRRNRMMRLRIPVGVAYGSDVPLVMKILLQCAQDHPSVMSSPKPQVLFIGFGDSSLDFELRVFVLNLDFQHIVSSEILQEIERQFRLNDIEIPFPQRDLHLRSVDESVISRIPKTTK